MNCKCYKCFLTSSSRQCQAKVRFEWGSLKLAVEMHNGFLQRSSTIPSFFCNVSIYIYFFSASLTFTLHPSFSWKYKLCDILWGVFLDYPSLLFAGFFVFGWMVCILSCCCLVNWSRCKRILNLNWSKQPVLCVHPLLSVWMINQAYVSPVVIRRRPQIIKFVSFSRL